MKKIILALSILFITSCAKQTIDVCFTPGMNCEAKIINEINKADDDIYVQAYSFTDANIANALLRATKRGVSVNLIVDKTQQSSFLIHALIPSNMNISIDYKVAIAHNKVIIIDQQEVITGSYNFTEAAQKRNAENLLIIKDRALAHKYLDNWFARNEVARTLSLEDITSKD